jgi:hypothetical protein
VGQGKECEKSGSTVHRKLEDYGEIRSIWQECLPESRPRWSPQGMSGQRAATEDAGLLTRIAKDGGSLFPCSFQPANVFRFQSELMNQRTLAIIGGFLLLVGAVISIRQTGHEERIAASKGEKVGGEGALEI